MRHPQYVRTGNLWAVTEPVTGKLAPAEQTEADIDITYNYSRYYYEATDGDIWFAHEDVSAYHADETQGPAETEYGIRGLYGSTSAGVHSNADGYDRHGNELPDGKRY